MTRKPCSAWRMAGAITVARSSGAEARQHLAPAGQRCPARRPSAARRCSRGRRLPCSRATCPRSAGTCPAAPRRAPSCSRRSRCGARRPGAAGRGRRRRCPTIIGSTTVSANSAATAASTALPPAGQHLGAGRRGQRVVGDDHAARRRTERFSVSKVRARARRASRPRRRRERSFAGSRQPGVPEVQARGGPEGAAQVAARHVEREVVAELHAADVLVEDRPGCARPAPCASSRRSRGASSARSCSFSSWHQLPHQLQRNTMWLAGSAVNTRPVEATSHSSGLSARLFSVAQSSDLQVDVEADLLELLLGHLGVLVHELVLARGHPADGLACA